MIDLTPLEVRKKKGDFRRMMRGYDPALVDDFLDMVADRMEQLVRQSLSSNERLSVLEAQVAEFRERERALTEALVTAQEMRNEIRDQVAKEADIARREAVAHAETIRMSALTARQKEEEAIRRLRARQMQLLSSYRSFLERELAELTVMAETLEVQRSRPVFMEQPLPGDEALEIEMKPAAAAPAAPTTPAPTTPAPQPTQVPRAAPQPKPTLEVNPPLTAHPRNDSDSSETAWVSTLIERKS